MTRRTKPDLATINGRLKAERRRLRLTQADAAKVVGCSTPTIAEWEAGRTSPTAPALAALGKAGLHIGYILSGKHGPFEQKGLVEAIVCMALSMLDQNERRQFLTNLVEEAVCDGEPS